jgi:osmotically inducible protein OsmC
MAIRRAEAVWEGDLKSGKGHVRGASGVVQGAYSFGTRFEEQPGTNPEELIAAAHAGCFSMALSAGLTRAGHQPRKIRTTAKVHLEKVGEGFGITRIELDTEGEIPGIDQATFQDFADKAKAGCPISKALAAVPKIDLKATLMG